MLSRFVLCCNNCDIRITSLGMRCTNDSSLVANHFCNTDSNYTIIGITLYGGRFQAFLTYFPSISHYFFIISLKISHFLTISQLFPIYFSYFSFLNNLSLISQLFLISQRCFSFLSYTSQIFLSYFSVTSRLFPSESLDISAIYNWLISAPISRRLLMV